MYLLDTNIVSELVKRVSNPNVIQRLGQKAPEALFISSITVFELRFGAARSEKPAALWTRIQQDIIGRFQILPFAQADAISAADLVAPLTASGINLSLQDAFLAGAALRNGFALVTRNRRDFDRIPALKIVNWFE